MNLLFCTVAEKFFLWKNYYIECMEKKKKEQIQGIKYKRRVLYPTIQLVIVNMYIKYAVSILYHCSDILEEICGGIEKCTKTRKN